MAGTFANVFTGPAVDGTPYAVNTPLTSNEADVNSAVPASVGSPVGVRFGEALLAIINLTSSNEGSVSGYCILQTSLDGGKTWVDVAGVLLSGLSGTWVISAGVAGAIAIQQTRAPGTTPAANFANQMALGGIIRFVAKATVTPSSSSSSSSSGSVTGAFISINYKLLALK